MQVVQVYPMENYDVAVYFADGNIKKYNVSHLVGKGVFSVLEDVNFYKENCTVLRMAESDETLESFYMNLIGGDRNA